MKDSPPRRGESSNAQICIPLTCKSDLDSIRLEDDVITPILSLFVLMIVRKSLRCVFHHLQGGSRLEWVDPSGVVVGRIVIGMSAM